MSQVGFRQGENPFPGLRPFDFEQQHLFFGRDQQVSELHQRLDRNRFLAVIGPSGSGKSSLIRAGLVPALFGGDGESGWKVAVFRPGDGPLDNLTAAVCEATDSADSLDEFAALAREGADGLVEMARRAGVAAGNRLLLIVDQFEEVFRVGQKSGDTSGFIDILLEASRQQDIPIYVVLTMRADFLGACTIFQGLPEAINNGQYLIPRMTRAEMRAAIEEPVAVAVGQIDTALVERLLVDMGDNPDQLPVMQHALMRTWEHWETAGRPGPIAAVHYEAVGTIGTALSQHAEEVFESLPGAESRRIAEVMFKCLTDRVDNPRGVRRPTSLHEVCAVADVSQGQVVEVAEHFRGRGRWFLTPGPESVLGPDSVLDVSHESLMRIWTRLHDWVSQEAESAQQYLRLANTAALYQEGKAGLYQDPDLELALNWRESNLPTSAWAQRYDSTFERAVTFLEHSRKERDFLVTTREERQRRQLRRARFMASLAGVASVIFLLFLLFTLNLFFQAEESERLAKINAEEAIAQKQIAEDQQRQAELARHSAEEQRLNAESQRETAERERGNAEKQRLIAEEQQRQAETSRRSAEQQRHIAEEQQRQAETSRRSAEQQRHIAEEQRQTAVHERQRAERLLLLSIARSLASDAVGVHRRNEDAALGGLLSLQAYLFHRRSGGAVLDSDIHNALRLSVTAAQKTRRDVWRGHEDEVRALVFGSEGRLHSAGADGRVLRWSADADGSYQPLAQQRQRLRALAYDPVSGRLIWGGSDGGVWLGTHSADTKPTRLLGTYEAEAFIVSAVAFSADGAAVAAAALDGNLRVWRPGESRRPVLVRPAGGRIPAMATQPGGTLWAWSDEQGKVVLEDFGGGDQREFAVPKGEVRALAFSRDGHLLAAGAGNGDIIVWNLDSPSLAPLSFTGHTSAVTALDFSPDGSLLVSGSLDRTLRLWDASDPSVESVLFQHESWVWAVAFAPDGLQFYSAGADKNIRVWEAHSRHLAQRACDAIDRDLTALEWQRYIGADIPYENTCSGLAALSGREGL
jgi:WD40 repeat protein